MGVIFSGLLERERFEHLGSVHFLGLLERERAEHLKKHVRLVGGWVDSLSCNAKGGWCQVWGSLILREDHPRGAHLAERIALLRQPSSRRRDP